MYKNILLAIDLTHPESWKKALPTTIDYAQNCQAVVHLITVIPDFGMSIVGGFFPKDYERQALDAAGEKLRTFARENIPEGIENNLHVTHGRSYEEILRAVDTLAIDLVVIGSNQPGTETYFLGSTASRVVRFAKCSVLVVRD